MLCSRKMTNEKESETMHNGRRQAGMVQIMTRHNVKDMNLTCSMLMIGFLIT